MRSYLWVFEFKAFGFEDEFVLIPLVSWRYERFTYSPIQEQ
jgi:hypothetical protein